MRPLDCNLIDPSAEGEPTARQCHERPGVLVIDDEHLVRIMIQLGLERDGFDVWLAANGLEAIQQYRTHQDRIAVVLLDVRMPGPDGPAILDELRNLNPEVLVCFMSGDPGDYRPEQLRERGAVCVIAKPFHLNELVHVLQLLTAGGPADAAERSAGTRTGGAARPF